jgi:hypothetical protein
MLWPGVFRIDRNHGTSTAPTTTPAEEAGNGAARQREAPTDR